MEAKKEYFYWQIQRFSQKRGSSMVAGSARLQELSECKLPTVTKQLFLQRAFDAWSRGDEPSPLWQKMRKDGLSPRFWRSYDAVQGK